MKSHDLNVIETLLTPEAVRQRCSQVFEAAEANGSKYFHIHNENFDAAEAKATLSKYTVEVLCHNHEHDEDEMEDALTTYDHARATYRRIIEESDIP